MSRISLIATAAVLILSLVSNSEARRVPPPERVAATGQRVLPPGVAAPDTRFALVDTTIIASWTFDDGNGGPDPQGWATVDLTAQLGAFFHVDDLAGLDFLDPPFEGAKSLWCGMRPCEIPEACSYRSLPGYGDGWYQTFESVAFPAPGDVNLSYLIRWDTEPSYDFVHVQYLSHTGNWHTLRSYTGSGAWSHSVTAPVDSLAGSVRFRFLFRSDGNYSDEDGSYDTDGAVVIDMIEVSSGGTIDYQDFEAEAVGALQTVDGHWAANAGAAFGDYASLFDGAGVLQEDSLYTNETHLWGFFNGSTNDYACGAHPEQPAVPFSKLVEGEQLYIDNAIVSPPVPMPDVAPGASVFLEFDFYRDLPLDNLVFCRWAVRSLESGVWGEWRDRDYVYWGAQKDWITYRPQIGDLIERDATEFQIRISAVDMCPVWCGSIGTGACHSHAPLLDNVRLVLQQDPVEFVVTNTNSSGAGSFASAVSLLNSNGAGIIRFDIPGPGPHTINVTSPRVLSWPFLIDGTTQPGYAGTPVVRLTSTLALEPGMLDLRGGGLLRGLEIDGGGVCPVGIALRRGKVEGCVIKNCTTAGIDVISGTDNHIGGPDPGQGNDIVGNGVGVRVEDSIFLFRATIRGNRIRLNNGIGIDLGSDGVTLNDAGDADTGPNELLNFPVLDYYAPGSPGWVGGYITGVEGMTYTIDFYSSSTCDPSGYGEGDTYLGSTKVVALANNQQTWFHAPLPSVPSGKITATTTDWKGNTSEFSRCNSTAINQFPVYTTQDNYPGSLRYAITQANNSGTRSLIRFALNPFPVPHVLSIGPNPLPAIVVPVIIDGYSQALSSPNTNPPGQPFNGSIPIILRGTVPAWDGLILAGEGSLVRGISVQNFLIGISIVASNCAVEGCLIGTHPTGPMGNYYCGIYVRWDSNHIGGPAPAQRNVIASNQFGMLIGDNYMPATGTEVYGNWIGLDASGALVGNYGANVLIHGDDTIFGGTGAGEGNVVAGGGEDGIAVYGARNRISGNSIYSNGWLGIDLYDPWSGVTLNDPGDADTGPNDLLNYPVITGAATKPGFIAISGTYSGAANKALEIQFFSNPTCDPSGHGEGQLYLGSKNIYTSSGNVTFSANLPVSLAEGQHVTAIAIDSYGNTSEFCACAEVGNTPPGTNVQVELQSGSVEAGLIFSTIVSPGATSLNVTGTCAELPGTFLGPDSLCYDITTTATFSGNVEVCFNYDEATLAGNESNVRLIHYDATLIPPQWVDITTSLDTNANRVCGETSSLSPFVVGIGSVTAAGPGPAPRQLALYQNVPNPFNPTTVIRYDVPVSGTPVTIRLYDVAGRLVRTLVDEARPAGVHHVSWDGRNGHGESVATGVYFCRMQAGTFVQTRKMVLLK
ncbi:MAG: T9SS type A sorting domain-containing protein [Candidatus Krumholzibacteria bacterium]|nr:T9SS type A sorting domain-containing protein [Candidatus Krumholzibacteria bacterium]